MRRRSFLVALLLAATAGAALSADKPPAPAAAARGTNDQVIAYYFHGTIRCETCLKIEKQAREAIERRFPVEMTEKRLVFKPVNYDYTGLFNFGHVAFFGIGAYTSALLTLHKVPFEISLLCALLLAGLWGFFLSIPSLRLRGDYFGIATLGFGEIIRMVFQNEVWLTKGPMGLPGIPKPILFSIRFATLPQYLLLVLGFAGITFLTLSVFLRSPFGRVLRAIREDEVATEVLAKNVFRFRVKSLVIGSTFAGLAGTLWAHYITFISPGDFTLLETILVLLIVVMVSLCLYG